MTEGPVDLTHKEKTSLWSCFQVCFPIVPQRPLAAKKRKSVSFAPPSSDAIDLRELEACLDHESSQKQETSITDSCTANESSENKNQSVLVEFWRYIVTFCFMGIMSCLHPGSRRAITDSAENLSEPTNASREPKDESKVDAAAS